MNTKEKHSQLLYGLLTSISTQAWIQLGKIKNPMTDKIERDLQGASVSIDMLDMLKSKMMGNLTSDEETLITSTLRDLKLNYVDELERPQDEESAENKPDDKNQENTDKEKSESE